MIWDLDAIQIKKIQDKKSYLGMKNLLERKDLVIRTADKGGVVVIVDNLKCIKEMYNILDVQRKLFTS